MKELEPPETSDPGSRAGLWSRSVGNAGIMKGYRNNPVEGGAVILRRCFRRE